MAIGTSTSIFTGGFFTTSLSGSTPSEEEVFTAGWWNNRIEGSGSFEAGDSSFFATDTIPDYIIAAVTIENDWDALIVGNTFKTMES